eukprot:CAMPEP_0119120966 /NCGR_PEP_ID=MMETSP1310-20130426/1788_1 /TAXON_ID=464262 /ORGANISM="Genus nov. species nov., Strain RCC2339" /LENGTH=926 /DNA_ID=CAMNT_0007110489 /DNA_START=42 /DNA_END=2818 /DNA_ORIENTATION=+
MRVFVVLLAVAVIPAVLGWNGLDDVEVDIGDGRTFVVQGLPRGESKAVRRGIEMRRSGRASVETLREKRTQERRQTPSAEDLEIFEEFLGNWTLESIDDWNDNSQIEFFVGSDSFFYARLYTGFDEYLNVFDPLHEIFAFNVINVATLVSGDYLVGDYVMEVEVLGARTLRPYNNMPRGFELSSDDLTSVLRIQDDNADVMYAQLYTEWDGVASSASVGAFETLMRYERRTGGANVAAPNTDWSDAANLFRYVRRYYQNLVSPQRAAELRCYDFVGFDAEEVLANRMLQTGVVRTARVSAQRRGDHYVGVWRTTDDQTVTLLQFDAPHGLTPFSSVTVEGFQGAYAVLNGAHRVAAPEATVFDCCSVPEARAPYADVDSYVYHVPLDYDSSAIGEAYDPHVHGLGLVTARHGPVSPGTGYREVLAALYDFLRETYGAQTHGGLVALLSREGEVFETFADLQTAMNVDSGLFGLYFGLRGSAGYAVHPGVYYGEASVLPNDPYLADWETNSLYRHDITFDNYVDQSRAYKVWYTLTGPSDPSQPITGFLDFYGAPFPNGSVPVFIAHPHGSTPAALVDEWGTHPYAPYSGEWGGSAEYGMLSGGILRAGLSPTGQTVAYVRVVDVLGWSGNLAFTVRPGAFSPGGAITEPFVAGLAALMSALNAHDPDRYIIDTRTNSGGFTYAPGAYASLFGGNRASANNIQKISSRGAETSSSGSLADLGIDMPHLLENLEVAALVDADQTAAAYPDAVFRAAAGQTVDLVVLTSAVAASGGDMLPRNFIGPDADDQRHNIGDGVSSRVVGDIDGRLFSGTRLFDALPPSSQFAISPLFLNGEAGVTGEDRHGELCNQQPWFAPGKLLSRWYDQTLWQDLGFISPRTPYPITTLADPSPSNPNSWRDVWLEYAITDAASAPTPLFAALLFYLFST